MALATRRDIAGRKCLVLGGGGFIGTNLCRRLHQAGATVRAFGRSRNFPNALKNIPWTQGDFADHSVVASALEESEIVFHLVGSISPESSNRAPIADLVTNTLNSLHFFELCRSSRVQTIVFVSSGGTVYGIQSELPIPETAPAEPISAYGISKLATEKYLRLFRHLYGLDYRILRVANPYGPFQSAYRTQGVVATLIHKALRGETLEIWGAGDVVRDFVYVDDVTDALIAAVAYEGIHRVFNVGTGIGRSINDIIADIGWVLNRGILAPIYRQSRASDVPANVLDISLIGREMRWRPCMSWLDGLRATADWIADPQTSS